MSSTHAAAIAQLIGGIEPIVTMERDGLVVIALRTSPQAAAPAYLTLPEAVDASAVDVHEIGGGSVPSVAVETRDRPVVIFGGDTIVGGKQHRIVNVTIWLAPHKVTPIPVTCLEHGRWDPGLEARFASGPRADLHLRSMLATQVNARARAVAEADPAAPAPERYGSDQGAVWHEVARKHQHAATDSPTGALHDLYAHEAPDVEALRRAFPYPDGASGAAIGIGGRLAALELFDGPATTRRLWPRIIEAAIRGHLDFGRLVAAGGARTPRHRFPDRGALGRMLGRVKTAQADALESPAVGEGIDVRFAAPHMNGAMLVREGCVIHLEAHRGHG